MANHKSAIKRIRSSETRRLRNKYQHKTTRNAVNRLREITNKKDAVKMLSEVFGMIDKLAKTNVIHKNKAANIKSGLQIKVNNL